MFTVNSKPPEKQAHHPAPLFIWRKGPQFPALSPALSITSPLACGESWWRPEVRLVLSFEISSQHSFPSCRPHVFPFLSLKNSSPYSSFPSHGPTSKGRALDIQRSSDFRDQAKNLRKVCLDLWILFTVFGCGGVLCDLIKPSSSAPLAAWSPEKCLIIQHILRAERITLQHERQRARRFMSESLLSRAHKELPPREEP